MEALRYFLVPAMTLTGVAGFILGGPFVWLGIATFAVLMLLDIVLPSVHKTRSRGIALVADIAI